MDKKNRRRIYHRSIIRILAAMLTVVLVLNTAVAVYAKEAMIPQISGYPLPLSDKAEKELSDDTAKVRAEGFENPGGKLLTGLVLKDLDEPVPGKPFDKAATITSAEGTVWDIPVFWIDGKGRAVDVPEKGKSYMPLLVFFVPDGFSSDGILTLPPYLSDLFLGTGGVLTIADHEHGITYITGNVAELSAALNNGSAEESVSGKEGYTNTAPDQQEMQESSVNPGEDKNVGHPENPIGVEESDKPDDPDDGQPGNEPENPDDGQPGGEPENPDDEQPGDEPEEPDPYVAFAEKYRNGRYKKDAWAEELEVLGGMENVDFVRLIRECGYNITVGIDYAARNAFEDEDQTVELMTALSSARRTVAKEIVDQADPYLKAHVDEALILKSNPESLLAFTHTLVDNIIPQTILVLRENFPAFANAPDEAFSKDLGFEIWTGQDAMGEASNSYEQTNDFRIRMRVYPESFMPSMDEKGAYLFDLKKDSRNLNEFKATMIHEMMHVFMYDYNRNGMDFFRKIPKTDDQLYPVPGFGDVTKNQLSDLRKTLLYPDWFAEGIATLFGDGFWSYYGMYSDLADPDDDSSYSAAGLYAYIEEEGISLDGTSSDYITAFYNDYLFGSLAVMYMGEMDARKTSGESAVRSDENGEKIVDTISIRNGLSDILERMHNGETMDSIFADISDGRYKDTREFYEKCFESEGPNEEVLTFIADVLNYVNSLKDENGGPVPASILRPFTENIFDLIDEPQSANTDIYVIPDTMGFTKSTVPEEIISNTGGKSDPSPILSPSEEKESSGEIMGSGNQLSAESLSSKTGSEPDVHEQTLTSDDAEQEVPEPVCEEAAADQEAEKQEESCGSEPDQQLSSSESGARETDESYGPETETDETCSETDAAECVQSFEADAA